MTKYRLYAIGLLLGASGFAQLDRGTITGILTDSSGARVPGVRIAAKNTATNAIYEAATTSAGEYTVVNLPSGTYDVTFEASGLKKLVRSKVLLAVSERCASMPCCRWAIPRKPLRSAPSRDRYRRKAPSPDSSSRTGRWWICRLVLAAGAIPRTLPSSWAPEFPADPAAPT